jgi:hypothetical protein
LQGSGFVIAFDGNNYILTSAHVVAGSNYSKLQDNTITWDVGREGQRHCADLNNLLFYVQFHWCQQFPSLWRAKSPKAGKTLLPPHDQHHPLGWICLFLQMPHWRLCLCSSPSLTVSRQILHRVSHAHALESDILEGPSATRVRSSSAVWIVYLCFNPRTRRTDIGVLTLHGGHDLQKWDCSLLFAGAGAILLEP